MVNSDEEKRLPVLLTVLGIFSVIWFGLFKTLNWLIHRQNELYSESNRLLLWVALIFSYQIFSFLVSIVKSIYYEVSLNWSKINLIKLRLKKDSAYGKIMNEWGYNLLFFILILLLVIYGRVLGSLGYLFGFMIVIILFLGWFFQEINPLLKERHKVKVFENGFKTLKEIFAKENNKIILKTSIFGSVTLILYSVTIIAMTAGIDVSLSNEIYPVNDTVILHIQPYGIIPPTINYVSYSNLNHIIYNGTNEPFGKSFRIVQIPKRLLTDKSYNSHAHIITSFISKDGKIYLGETYRIEIPVYTPIKSELNRNTILNKPISGNQTKNSSPTLLKEKKVVE